MMDGWARGVLHPEECDRDDPDPDRVAEPERGPDPERMLELELMRELELVRHIDADALPL
jgi:hypothetical protein